MKTESLNAVMLDVLRNNQQVGKSLVEAYRTRGTRLVEKGLSPRFGGTGQKVGDFLVKGIDKSSDSAEGMMTGLCKRACDLLAKLDDNPYAVKYLGLVGKAALPGAKIVRNLSGRLADRVTSGHRSAATAQRTRRVKHRTTAGKSAAA
jgi:hypothetical protein